MSEGMRSGVNWMRLNSSVEHVGEGVDEQRLGEPGHADEEAVAAREEGDEQVLDHLAAGR